MFDMSVITATPDLTGKSIIKVYKDQYGRHRGIAVSVVTVVETFEIGPDVTALAIVKVPNPDDVRVHSYEVIEWLTGRSFTTPSSGPQETYNKYEKRKATVDPSEWASRIIFESKRHKQVNKGAPVHEYIKYKKHL